MTNLKHSDSEKLLLTSNLSEAQKLSLLLKTGKRQSAKSSRKRLSIDFKQNRSKKTSIQNESSKREKSTENEISLTIAKLRNETEKLDEKEEDLFVENVEGEKKKSLSRVSSFMRRNKKRWNIGAEFQAESDKKNLIINQANTTPLEIKTELADTINE